MKLVLNRAVFFQLCRILDTSRNKFATRVSLIGRTARERVVIQAARQIEKESAPTTTVARAIGVMFFHPDGQYLLTPEEKQQIWRRLLRQNNEVAAVVAVIARDGDLAFYPVFFSWHIPDEPTWPWSMKAQQFANTIQL
jgi:hypothetical protein